MKDQSKRVKPMITLVNCEGWCECPKCLRDLYAKPHGRKQFTCRYCSTLIKAYKG